MFVWSRKKILKCSITLHQSANWFYSTRSDIYLSVNSRWCGLLDWLLLYRSNNISQHLVNSDMLAVCERRALLTAWGVSGFSASVSGADVFPPLQLRLREVQSVTILGCLCRAPFCEPLQLQLASAWLVNNNTMLKLCQQLPLLWGRHRLLNLHGCNKTGSS